MFLKHKTFIALVISCILNNIAAYADTNQPSPNQAAATTSITNTSTITQTTQDSNEQIISSGTPVNDNSATSVQIKANFCPKESELKQDKNLIWYSGTGWKSFSPSFVKKIGTFISAQWTGINFGKVICIYQGEKSFDFPVALEQRESKLYLRPEGHGWNLSIKGYIICRSNSIYNCPFYIREEEDKVPSSSQIYQGIEYKGPNTSVNTSN